MTDAGPPPGRRAEPSAGDPGFGLPPELVEDVEAALDAQRLAEVEALLEPLHSADLAEVLERLHPQDRGTVVGLLRPLLQTDPEVLTYLNDEVRAEILERLDPDELGRALGALDTDDALGLIEDLDEEDRRRILAGVPAEARLLVEEGLTYPEDSAGRLMQRDFVAVPLYWTVGKTIDFLRAAADLPDDFYLIFAVDPMHRPVGAALLSRILRSKRSVRIADLISDDIRPISASTDQEEVAFLFRRYGLVSAPVVDEAGRLIGVVTVDDVVDVIDEEAEEDLLKLGGVREDDLYRAVLDTARSRVSWLVVNLLTAFVASTVIAMFDHVIARIVALAVLMPIVAGMGGNAGTQALTVAVRAIAMKELDRRNAWRVLSKEVLVGALNGLFVGLVTGIVAMFWFGEPLIGLIIGLGLVINLIAAGFSGVVIPLTLNRLKIDPAIASPVFLTMVTDVVGFLAFLGLAALILL